MALFVTVAARPDVFASSMCGVSEVRPPAALKDCRSLTVSHAHPLTPSLVHDPVASGSVLSLPLPPSRVLDSQALHRQKQSPDHTERSGCVLLLCFMSWGGVGGGQLAGRLLQALHVYTCRKVGGCGEGIGWA